MSQRTTISNTELHSSSTITLWATRANGKQSNLSHKNTGGQESPNLLKPMSKAAKLQRQNPQHKYHSNLMKSQRESGKQSPWTLSQTCRHHWDMTVSSRSLTNTAKQSYYPPATKPSQQNKQANSSLTMSGNIQVSPLLSSWTMDPNLQHK